MARFIRLALGGDRGCRRPWRLVHRRSGRLAALDGCARGRRGSDGWSSEWLRTGHREPRRCGRALRRSPCSPWCSSRSVCFGPLARSSRARQTQAVTSPPAAASQTLYQQALQAQSSGDMVRTAELAQAALDADPNNAEAKALLGAAKKAAQRLRRGIGDAERSGDSSCGSRSGRGVSQEVRESRVVDAHESPRLHSRFAAAVRRDITMSGNRVPASQGVTQLSWAVHDLKSEAAAKSFVAKTSKKAFPKNPGTVTVHGTKAYFGTDGTRFATVSFSRGRYAFEVLVTVNGVAPKTAKSVASEAAKVFPASPAP